MNYKSIYNPRHGTTDIMNSMTSNEQKQGEEYLDFWLQNFFIIFSNSIMNENFEILLQFILENRELIETMKIHKLPSVAFSNEILSCFLKAIQPPYAATLQSPIVFIFSCFYIDSEEKNLYPFFDNGFFHQLVNSLLYYEQSEAKVDTLEMLLKITTISDVYSDKIFSIFSLSFFDELSKFSEIYDQILAVFLGFLSKYPNINFKHYYFPIGHFFMKYVDKPNEAQKKCLFEAMKSLALISERDEYFFNNIQHHKINDCLMNHFLLSKNEEIINHDIRLLSSIFDYYYYSFDEADALDFDIKLTFENDVNTNFDTYHFLVKYFTFSISNYITHPSYSDIPGHVCQVLTSLIIYLKKSKNKNSELGYKINNFLIREKIHLNLFKLFEYGTENSQIYACRLANELLKGPKLFVQALIQNKFIRNISKLLESDNADVVYPALQFINLLILDLISMKISYPILEDFAEFGIFDYLNNIIENFENEQAINLAQIIKKEFKNNFCFVEEINEDG